VEINMPDENTYSVRNIFTNIIKHEISKTRTSHEFKAAYDLELDKIVTFFQEYMTINNKNC
jgi:hypothetical protein